MATENIVCPICEKEKTWREDNPFRPFCSERCKITDLGEWVSEKRNIPGEPAAPPPDSSASNNIENEGND
jgi:endogenous inhibitor of DNA gyrase (YacG/DUF329 family)